MAFIYSDLNGFNPTDAPLLTDIQVIYQSLFNILNTRPGERLFEPEFGLGLESSLFELNDAILTLSVMQNLVSSVQNFEQRVVVDTQNTTITRVTGKNELDLSLIFQINGIPSQSFQLVGTLS